MPAKRSYADAAGRPRRMLRARRKTAARAPRMLRTQQITVARKFWASYWVPGTAATTDFWKYYQFQPNQIPNWSDFFNLFDQYKINALKFSFVPRSDGFAGNDTTDTTLPGVTNAAGTRLHVVNDPYSTVVPAGLYSAATLNSMMEQGTTRTFIGTKTVDVYFKPTINVTTEAGSNYRVKAPWLNVNVQNVHNGFHIMAQDSNFVGLFNQSYDVFITAYASFRNLR